MTAKDLYDQAYRNHYSKGLLDLALPQYQAVIDTFPDSPEARYAKTQIENIAKSVHVSTGEPDWAQRTQEELRARQASEADQLAYAGRDIPLATTPNLHRFEVTASLDVVAAECALRMGLLQDVTSSLVNKVVRRSEATEAVLREARDYCLGELRSACRRLGGDAVVSVTIGYHQISGRDTFALLVTASGTAVKTRPETAPEHHGDGDHQ